MHEYKAIMSVILGVLSGVCPNDAIDLVREYLHIFRLSHYTAHTDASLKLLDSAVHTFWTILKDPNRVFMKRGLLEGKKKSNPLHWAPSRMHYFSHYSHAIREKGILPGCSTDRTEPSHKDMKRYYEMSNKKEGVEKSMCRSESRSTAMKKMKWRIERDGLHKPSGSGARVAQAEGDEEDIQADATTAERDTIPEALPSMPLSGHQVAARKIVWQAKRRRGWPQTVEKTAEILKLETFEGAFREFNKGLPEGRRWDETRKNVGALSISVYNGITLEYAVN